MNKITKKKVSFAVPCYNEEQSIIYFVEEMKKCFLSQDYDIQIIFVNDGSKDKTLLSMMQVLETEKLFEIKIINLSRNFGKDIALTAAIDNCDGDCVIPIDVDLQDPPEVAKQMINLWLEGNLAVVAKRISRHGESFIKRSTAALFYKIINLLSDIEIHENVGDFRLIDKVIVSKLKLLNEKNRFMKGIFAWLGFNPVIINYNRHNRKVGNTKWNYWKLWNFALDGIFSFSSFPLKIWSYLGFSITICSLLYAIFTLVKTLIYGISLPGYASLLIFVLFLGGVNLMGLGLIGEYLARVYVEVKQRPLYIVSNTIQKNEKTNL